MNKTSFDSEIPQKGQQVITACAFIHHDISGEEKVLLAKRSKTRKFLPNIFELPGGHINWGEDITEGLKREVFEELGIKIKVNDPFAVFTYINQVKGTHSVEIVYFARPDRSIETIKTNPRDHSEFAWFSRKELEALKSVSESELKNIKRGFAILE